MVTNSIREESNIPSALDQSSFRFKKSRPKSGIRGNLGRNKSAEKVDQFPLEANSFIDKIGILKTGEVGYTKRDVQLMVQKGTLRRTVYPMFFKVYIPICIKARFSLSRQKHRCIRVR